jgi:hypothetical protein
LWKSGLGIKCCIEGWDLPTNKWHQHY